MSDLVVAVGIVSTLAVVSGGVYWMLRPKANSPETEKAVETLDLTSPTQPAKWTIPQWNEDQKIQAAAEAKVVRDKRDAETEADLKWAKDRSAEVDLRATAIKAEKRDAEARRLAGLAQMKAAKSKAKPTFTPSHRSNLIPDRRYDEDEDVGIGMIGAAAMVFSGASESRAAEPELQPEPQRSATFEPVVRTPDPEPTSAPSRSYYSDPEPTSAPSSYSNNYSSYDSGSSSSSSSSSYE